MYALDEVLKSQPGLKKAASKLTELRKSLNVVASGEMLKEGMAEPAVLARYPQLAAKFRAGLSAESILWMIDLSPFSSLVSDWEPWLIAAFLEKYYRTVVSRVADEGGIVEKYIGDAVLAAFGAPFDEQTEPDTLEKVVRLSRSLVKEVEQEFNGEVTAKCAISYGSCFYGYLGPEEHHPELTIIGNPLTVLFRLESVCPERSVILLKDLFDEVAGRFPLAAVSGKAEWVRGTRSVELKGVGEVDVVVSTLK